MTITKEQVREAFEHHWRKTRKDKKADRELTRHPLQPQTYTQDNANRHWITWDRAFHAGAKAKLAELLAGVEMPEPEGSAEVFSGNNEHGLPEYAYMDAYTLDQLRTAVAAAVAKEREACAQLMEEQDTQQPKHNAKAIRARSNT